MHKFLSSRMAFYIIVALFAVESLFVALTARYPMAFDEYFHYGVAQLHTQSWLPFLQNTPADTSLYGAIARDPSFLYHYLLSFPLRVLNLVTDNLTWHILILRLLNIVIAIASLFVYRRLLRRIGTSPLVTNVILFFLVLIPVLPLMAGQVTYDNLFLLLVPTVLLLAVGFIHELDREQTINITKLHAVLLTGLFTCFVKYPFIPALFAIVVYFAVVISRRRELLGPAYRAWWHQASLRNKTVTLTALVIGLWFFAGSYGLNTVRYHTPLPDCDVVLSVSQCMNYGPWARDYTAMQAGGHATLKQIPWYTNRWTRQMMTETFFMVGAKFAGNGVVTYYSTQPLSIIFMAAWTLLIAGFAVLVWRIKYIWRNPVYRLIVVTVGVYGIVLFLRNLQFYLQTGEAVAIHGRYMLPFIPPLVAVITLSARQVDWPQFFTHRRIAVVGVIAAVCFLQGGLVSYVVLTDKGWMWPQSQAAQETTNSAKKILSL